MTSGLRPSFVSESSGVCRVFARRAPDVCQASIPDFSGAFFFRRLPGLSSRAVRCRPDLVRVHPASLHPPLHSAPRVFCIRHLYPISVSAPIPFQSHSHSGPIPATSYRPPVPASAPLGLSYEKASPRRKISAGARLFFRRFSAVWPFAALFQEARPLLDSICRSDSRLPAFCRRLGASAASFRSYRLPADALQVRALLASGSAFRCRNLCTGRAFGRRNGQSRKPSFTSCSRMRTQSATGRLSPSTKRSGHPRALSSI